MSSQNYLQHQQLLNAIISAASMEVKIEISNADYPEIIYPLDGLFNQRKIFAIHYLESDREELKEQFLRLFVKVNDEIKKVIGL